MSRSISRLIVRSAGFSTVSPGRSRFAFKGFTLTLSLPVAALCLALSPAFAQEPAKPSPLAATKAPATTPRALNAGPQWHELSGHERTALAPLQGSWGNISEGHKRKWMALSSRYDKLSPDEQHKLHERMTEWAGLSVAERNRARLNFAETKRLDPSEKQAKWEAYQALSSEEKHKLAEQAPKPPAGAAPAVRSSARPKLANTYVEQRPGPQTQLAPSAEQRNIDSTTLLPQQP